MGEGTCPFGSSCFYKHGELVRKRGGGERIERDCVREEGESERERKMEREREKEKRREVARERELGEGRLTTQFCQQLCTCTSQFRRILSNFDSHLCTSFDSYKHCTL